MKVYELVKLLENEDPNAEVITVVYTDDSYESGYIDKVFGQTRYNSVTQERLKDDESVVEITTSTKG